MNLLKTCLWAVVIWMKSQGLALLGGIIHVDIYDDNAAELTLHYNIFISVYVMGPKLAKTARIETSSINQLAYDFICLMNDICRLSNLPNFHCKLGNREKIFAIYLFSYTKQIYKVLCCPEIYLKIII